MFKFRIRTCSPIINTEFNFYYSNFKLWLVILRFASKIVKVMDAEHIHIGDVLLYTGSQALPKY